MLVTVHGEQKYIPVSTVTLQRTNEQETYPFHCVNCGNTSNIIGGKVIKIYPILEPSTQIPVISTCKSCKAKYVFQDAYEVPVKTTAVKVLLFPKSEMQSFFCYLGGGEVKSLNKILEYDKLHAYSVRLRTSIKLPLVTRCTNDNCDITYQFTKLS